MSDLGDYQVRQWFENGLLKRIEDKVVTAKVQVGRSISILAACALVGSIHFSDLPTGVTSASWHAAVSQGESTPVPTLMPAGRVEFHRKSIDARLAGFAKAEMSEHEASLLDGARAALAAIAKRQTAA